MTEAKTLRHIELKQHPYARSNDPTLLKFLGIIREKQPDKTMVRDFFGTRRLAKDCNCRKSKHIAQAVRKSKDIEQQTGKPFTFLTVTNAAALKINHTRCAMDFGQHPRIRNAKEWMIPGDPKHGGGYLVPVPGMRIRLTRNVDKQRGFVNGALAEIEYVLHRRVFIAKTPRGVRMLVHPVAYEEHGTYSFMPFSYGYAMTIRRAQGSTTDQVALWFDHKYAAERGYGYVGASRVRAARGLYLMGKVKRSDWLPVGQPTEDEQLQRGYDSAITSDSDFGSEDPGMTSSDDDEDQGMTDDSAETTDDEDYGQSSADSDL